MDFGANGVAKVAAEFSSNTDNGAIEVFVDDPTVASNKIATMSVKNTGYETYEEVQTDIAGDVTGVHDVYFVFRGSDYRVASWSFAEKQAASVTPTPDPSNQATNPPAATITPSAVPSATVTPDDNKKVTVAKPAIKSVKNVKGKKIAVTLKKKVSGASGYEIRYSLKKNMKAAKKVTLKKASALKATIKGLKKKTYYVQARAYKTVDGKKTYSAWSSKKSVKVKK